MRLNLKASFIIWVLLPTLVALLYYALVATPRYVIETRFVIKSNQPSSAASELSGLLGSSTGATTILDGYVLRSYIRSLTLLNDVNKDLSLQEIFGSESIDYFSRMPPFEQADSLLKYWNKRIRPSYEVSTGIIDLQVSAFSPDDSLALTNNILKHSENLINALSAKARKDTLALAEKEVSSAEQRLLAARQAITNFRNQNQALDPTKSAETQVGIIGTLEGELAKSEAELISLRSYARPNAPTVRALESKIAGLKRQISNEEIGTATSTQGGASMTSLLDEYEKLQIEHEFASKLYESALSSLESARIEANQQQRYLATFVVPEKPQESIEPDLLYSTLTVFLAAFLLWGIGSITLASVKDHIGWE